MSPEDIADDSGFCFRPSLMWEDGWMDGSCEVVAAAGMLKWIVDVNVARDEGG